MESLKHIDNKPLEHIERDVYGSWHHTERVKRVLNGTSKRRKGFTQDEVACLFVHDYDCESGTRNFRSEKGVLWHYRTVEAVKSVNGLVINNRNCWSRGFAHCSTPPLVNYALDLSIFPFNAETLRTLEIIDHKDTSQNERSATLVKINEVYFLNAFDDSDAFVAELHGKPRTVKEAFESMKPKIVKLSENMGLKVKRQGELFFIPTQAKNSDVKDIEKRARNRCIRVYFQCQKCGIKTTPRIFSDEKEYREELYAWHPHFSKWHHPPSITEQQVNCDGDKKDMKPFFYLGWEYSPYPQIGDTRHAATRLGTYVEKLKNATFKFAVAQGIIRHPQHTSLKLTKQWHIVAKNRAKRSYTQIGVD